MLKANSYLKKNVQSIRMLNLALKELKVIAKNRGIKVYKSMSKDKLFSMLNTPEPIKENKTIEDIRKDNSNIDEIINLIKPLFEQEPIKENKTIKNIRKENFNNDKILRDARSLFESDNEDYYGLVRIGNAFSSNYIEHESNRDKDKTLSIKEYLDKIRAYLSHTINDLKPKVNGKFN